MSINFADLAEAALGKVDEACEGSGIQGAGPIAPIQDQVVGGVSATQRENTFPRFLRQLLLG